MPHGPDTHTHIHLKSPRTHITSLPRWRDPSLETPRPGGNMGKNYVIFVVFCLFCFELLRQGPGELAEANQCHMQQPSCLKSRPFPPISLWSRGLASVQLHVPHCSRTHNVNHTGLELLEICLFLLGLEQTSHYPASLCLRRRQWVTEPCSPDAAPRNSEFAGMHMRR